MPDAIVIGAGPGGSSAATFLAIGGIDTLLLDRSVFPRDKPCGEYLSPGAYPILVRLGIWDKLEEINPRRLQGMRVISYNGNGFIGEFPDKEPYQLYKNKGFAIRRILFDNLLAKNATAHGVTFRDDFVVTDLMIHEGRVIGVKGHSKGGESEEIKAKLVIGADGINSIVARKLLLDHPIPALARVGLVTHYENMLGLNDYGEMHAAPECYCGIAPINESLANVSIGVIQEIYQERKGSPEDLFHELMERFPKIKVRLQGARQVGSVKPMGPLAHWTHRATWDGAMLVGDAAGFIDPYTGEGMFLALRSGELAAGTAIKAFHRGEISQESLSMYDHARAKELNKKYLLSKLIQHILRTPWLMDFMVGKLSGKKKLRDLLVGSTGDFIPSDQILSPAFTIQLLFI